MSFWGVVLAVVVGFFVAVLISVMFTLAALYTLQRAFWADETRTHLRR